MKGRLSGGYTHGTRATYVAGCRGPDGCEACRRAEAAYRRSYRMRGAASGYRCRICNELFATDMGRQCHETKSHR